MTSIRASLLTSGLLHAAAIGGAGWYAASAAGRATVQAEIRVQFDGAPAAFEPQPAQEVDVRIESVASAPPTAEARHPEEWLDPRLFEPAPRAGAASVVEPPPPDAVWFRRVRPAPEPSPRAEEPAARVVEVIPGENPPPEYPWLARRRGYEGTVAIAVTVDAAGVVAGARVERSSRHALLDAAALRAVRTWRFRHGPGASVVEVEFALRAR